jgi:hypothetical protein
MMHIHVTSAQFTVKGFRPLNAKTFVSIHMHLHTITVSILSLHGICYARLCQS